MSRINDGKDVLKFFALPAYYMREWLGEVLEGNNNPPQEGTFSRVKQFFHDASSYDPTKRVTNLNLEREFPVKRRILTDMISRVDPNCDVESKLRELESAVSVLTLDGIAVSSNPDSYRFLVRVLDEVVKEGDQHESFYGSHSPYVVGTFNRSRDDDD